MWTRTRRRLYSELPGPLGEELREQLCFHPEPHFKMTADGRCPFLNDEGRVPPHPGLGGGLRSATSAGSTPDFITNSPGGRRRAWDSVVKRRQGCCSTGEKPLELIYETEGELEDEEPELIALRRQLLDILSDTAIPMKERISRCCALMDMEPLSFDMSFWRDFYLGLERLDETWTAALENLGPADVEPPGDMAHTRLLQYLIYRHFASAGNRREAALMLQFCILSLGLISALERSGAELSELVRLYSSEIEYSDENIAQDSGGNRPFTFRCS